MELNVTPSALTPHTPVVVFCGVKFEVNLTDTGTVPHVVSIASPIDLPA
jgi:hypothetical protein